MSNDTIKAAEDNDQKFFLHVKRSNGYEATMIVDKGNQHRNTVFGILSCGGKIISNKKVKPFPKNSVQEK